MEWFEKSLRRNLIDIHITEDDERFLSEFDAEAYADAVVSSGVDTAILYSASCLGLCYFPTKAGHMHRNIKGRDMLAEMLAACKARGLKTVVYFNIWSRWAYDTHPEWRMRTADGKGYSVELGLRFGQCCPNTGYFEYVRQQVTQLIQDYECDGLWIDMIGWFDNVCYCDACREKFRNQTGKELPEIIHWGDEDWKQFHSFREESIIRMAEMIRNTARELKPSLSVTQQCSSWERGWVGASSERFLSHSDYLAGDFYVGSTEQSVICKFLSNLTQNRPIEYMVSRCLTLSEHTTNKSKELLTAQRAAAIANNTAFVFIDAIDPVGTVNPKIFRQMGQIFEELSVYEKEQQIDSRLQADVAVFLSLSAMCNASDNGRNIRNKKVDVHHIDDVYALSKTLIEGNLPYDVVGADQLLKGNYKVLIMSDVIRLTAKEQDAIRMFVQNGGKLYASRNTSLYSEGAAADQFGLADLFGARACGETPWEETFLVPEGEKEFFGDFSKKYPIEIVGRQQQIELTEPCEVWGSLALPYFPPQDVHQFASALSDPPGIYTAHPALICRNYGKGQVVYCAAKPEVSDADVHREFFRGLIASLVGDSPILKTNAPKVAETIVWKRKDDLLVNLLNFQTPLPPVPLYHTELSIRMDDMELVRAVDVSTGEELPVKVENGYITFTVPKTEYLSSVKLLKKE
ncbi:MAG: alpha-L-fucosidase [Oscillospiraceae bacterium]|nr:alpha-L-fucosidase [Oscillospiraceae bacterium]